MEAEPLATSLWDQFLRVASQSWTLYQALIIVATMLVAFALARLMQSHADKLVPQLAPTGFIARVRKVLVLRLHWMLLPVLLAGVAALMRVATWPSRSYFVGLAAWLALAWLIILALSQFIKNHILRRLFAMAVWLVFALNGLGIWEETTGFLDQYALDLGQLRLSLWVAIKAVFFLAAALWIAGQSGRLLDYLLGRSDEVTPALKVLLGKVGRIVIGVIAVVVALSSTGIDLTALTVFSGAIGLGIGFGLQKVVSNLLSGVIILSDRSIKPGDVISLGETFGWIHSLRARYVSVITRDGREYLIPNDDFVTNQVVNWSFSDKLVRIDVHFGVSYDADPHQVRKLIVERISQINRIVEMPSPVCHVTGFGDSSVDLIARFWIADPEGGLTNIRGQVFLAIWDVLQENEISIPFPHREVFVHPASDGAPIKVDADAGMARGKARAKPAQKSED